MSDSAAEDTSAQPLRVSPRTPLGTLALLWGVGGFLALLAFAVWRLFPLALESTTLPWGALHWTLFVANLAAMAWFEGYRAFQSSYSPRLAARALHLYRHATARQAGLAPLVCMGFLDAPRRRVLTSCAVTAGIVVVIVAYRQLPQPWRGILDAGVVVGLLWGLLATVAAVRLALRDGPAVDAEMLGSEPSPSGA